VIAHIGPCRQPLFALALQNFIAMMATLPVDGIIAMR
jgi:hypothetical protein